MHHFQTNYSTLKHAFGWIFVSTSFTSDHTTGGGMQDRSYTLSNTMLCRAVAFPTFPSIFNIFINVHEYANGIIFI